MKALADFLSYHLYMNLPWPIQRRRWVENLLLPGAGSYAYRDVKADAEEAP